VEVVYECGAGLDVHQKSITAGGLWALPKGKKKQEKRRFGTFTQDVLAMADLDARAGGRTGPWNRRACTGSQCGTSWKGNSRWISAWPSFLHPLTVARLATLQQTPDSVTGN
jgi:hypothetical protein